MKLRTRIVAMSLALAVVFGSVLLLHPPPASFGQETIPSSRVPACGCYVCGKLMIAGFPNAASNCAGILAADACPDAMRDQNMSEAQREVFCAKLRGGLSSGDFKTKCPMYAAMCPAEPEPECEKYSGEITCDCNGDGTDDATKTFESCGPKSSFPRQFKSRCEQWARADGGFSYPTDIRIQRAAQEWLNSIACPGLDCQEKHAACTGPLETNLQKCLTGNRLLGSRRRCQQYYADAKTKCEKARATCLNAARTSGSGPVPRPLPTPTPSGGFLKPMSLWIFDPGIMIVPTERHDLSSGPCTSW